MKTLINKILENSGFQFNDELQGYQQADKSFYFYTTLVADQLAEVKDKNSLNKSEWYQSFLLNFNELCQSDKYPALEKNSSLLIFVEGSSITELSSLQSQILLLEEDQFFLKKYVIYYTSSAFEKIKDLSLNEELLEKVNDKERFDKLMKNGLSDEIEDYVLILQLFIKLPFLKLKFNEDNYVALSDKLKNLLSNDFELYCNVINSYQSLINIDFESPESNEEIDFFLNLIEP